MRRQWLKDNQRSIFMWLSAESYRYSGIFFCLSESSFSIKIFKKWWEQNVKNVEKKVWNRVWEILKNIWPDKHISAPETVCAKSGKHLPQKYEHRSVGCGIIHMQTFPAWGSSIHSLFIVLSCRYITHRNIYSAFFSFNVACSLLSIFMAARLDKHRA